MDLITHTIVSSATYRVVTQDTLSIDDPGLIATAIGAIIPDMDIVTQLFGDIPYFKYHRGFTHSILGVLIFSFVNGWLLSILFNMSSFHLFLYTLLGGTTHILLDTLNSYGAQIFWPFSKRRVTLNLLVFIEPFMVISFLLIILFNNTLNNTTSTILFGLVLLYFALRSLSKLLLNKMLKRKFPHKKFDKIVIVPAFASILHWDYILEDNKEVILGRTTLTLKNFHIKKRLPKVEKNPIVKKALLTKLGKLFADFTPHFYIWHEKQGDKHFIRFIDLRYLVKEGFVNSAVLKLSNQGDIKEAFFQPYSENRKIALK